MKGNLHLYYYAPAFLIFKPVSCTRQVLASRIMGPKPKLIGAEGFLEYLLLPAVFGICCSLHLADTSDQYV